MKRVKAACICQTLHFMLKEDAPHEWAVKQVEQEIELYIKTPIITSYSLKIPKFTVGEKHISDGFFYQKQK